MRSISTMFPKVRTAVASYVKDGQNITRQSESRERRFTLALAKAVSVALNDQSLYYDDEGDENVTFDALKALRLEAKRYAGEEYEAAVGQVISRLIALAKSPRSSKSYKVFAGYLRGEYTSLQNAYKARPTAKRTIKVRVSGTITTAILKAVRALRRVSGLNVKMIRNGRRFIIAATA